ncbi:MAG: DUF998 domain-containing protein [Methanobacteriota archaeon]|nr:MAG: DUF998 domain-containing protein [Euryarchaeota archaeon]
MSRIYNLVGSICGIPAPIIFLICYLISWSQSPWYVFGGRYLSDLGVGEGAIAFNTGLIVAGLLALPFAFSLWRLLGTTISSSLGAIVLAASGIALMSVGIFTEDFGNLHFIVSVLFFSLTLLTVLLLIWPLIRSPRFKYVGFFSFILTLTTLAVVAPIGFNPLSETIAVMMILVWMLVVAARSTIISIKEDSPDSITAIGSEQKV